MTSLSTSEIKQAISINSRTIIKEVYDTALRQVQSESSRQSTLESKATALLSAVGLAMTLLFTLGCQILLGASNPFAGFNYSHRIALFICFVASIIAALLSSAHAIWALRISDKYRYVGELNIFDKETLLAASTHKNDDDAVTEYRRWLVPSLWAAFKNDYDLHKRKAALIYRGQLCFLAFVVSLMDRLQRVRVRQLTRFRTCLGSGLRRLLLLLR
jgi:hypothetical protein